MIKLYVKHHQSTTINFRLVTRLRGCWITKQESGWPSEFLTIMVMKNALMLTFVCIVKSITNLQCSKAFKDHFCGKEHSVFLISYHIPHPRTDFKRATLPNSLFSRFEHTRANGGTIILPLTAMTSEDWRASLDFSTRKVLRCLL